MLILNTYIHTHFHTVCAMFSVVGFIFSCCLATTVAAQSGALAGLGVAFISKPILFEVHNSVVFCLVCNLGVCRWHLAGCK